MMRRIALASTLSAVVFFGPGCAPQVVVPAGRSCTSSTDCEGGQTCRDGICTDRMGGGDAAAGTGTGTDAGPGTGVGDDGGTTMPPPDAVEICGNGRDDDGDGEVEEQCACAPGESQECYGGPVAAAGAGICAMGTQACAGESEFGGWGPCTGWTPPADEACDGIDNDCDGTADEGCACSTGDSRSCYVGPSGTSGVGICRPGSQVCTDGEWGACSGSALPATEICDDIDNDCDGVVDEGCNCEPGTTRVCYETPSGAPGTGTPGVGICREGLATCVTLPGGGAAYGPCAGAVTAAAEICNNSIDEDCDGTADDGCTPPIVDCTVADVLFLIDITGSMSQEIAQIQARLTDTIIPGLAAEIADVRFAVASFGDFPVTGYGGSSDRPFTHVTSITSSVSATQTAVNTLSAYGGGDGPESQVEALYQSATGAGISPWVGPRSCAAGTVGYPCFRSGATPIILLFTDADFHNGPGGASSYSGIAGDHAYDDAVMELNRINAKVLGLMSGAAASAHLNAIARDTGAVASDGSPIVFDIGSNGASLGTDVVRAVQTLCR